MSQCIFLTSVELEKMETDGWTVVSGPYGSADACQTTCVGSSSGSGGGCCDTYPSTITVTIKNVSGLPCMDGLVITLTSFTCPYIGITLVACWKGIYINPCTSIVNTIEMLLSQPTLASPCQFLPSISPDRWLNSPSQGVVSCDPFEFQWTGLATIGELEGTLQFTVRG